MPMNRPKAPNPPAATPAHTPEDIAAVRRLLAYIGEDPDREGLLETPVRFLKAWEEYTRGYRMNPEEILKSFEDGAQAVDEMVIVRDIPVYSLCEHHLAPFFGKAYVGYVLDTHLKPLGVAVVIECRHMCMESRGVRHTGTATVTSALRGSIKANADTRREFLSLIGR